ncbi:glucose-1-phosphate adenylyltransferase [Flavobacteriaceae bacterium UJ101]|nr:glucose-1-phosphate adenylyltransferase [Flavobacteriaceae bacterium UJ101]
MTKLGSDVLSVILGGGRGTRLHPLSYQRAKPAVPVAGKYRLVDIPISNCLNSKMNKIYVLTQFNSASLNRHIKNAYAFDIFSKGFVHILAAEQTPQFNSWNQGTADAVRRNIMHFDKVDFDYMLILSGDQLYHMDYQVMLEHHKKNNAAVSIATIPVNANDATGFGIMKKDENDTITSFIEKPSLEELENWKSDTGVEMQDKGRDYLASMGIYIFNREVIFDILNNTDAKDFGKEVIPNALGQYKVVSFQHNGYWTDIGTIKSFFEANLDLADDVPQFNLYDNRDMIYTNPRLLPTSKIMGTEMKNTVISDGCIIHAKELSRAVIGIRTRIGKETVIKNTYILGADHYETIQEMEGSGIPPIGIGENCKIENAIIDKNCRIGNNVEIVGGEHLEDRDEERYTIIDGIIVVKKNMILEDGLKIG